MRRRGEHVRASTLLLACVTIASVSTAQRDVQPGSSENPNLAPMIISPKPGAEICPDTVVTASGIDQPGAPRVYALDQEFLSVRHDQVNKFHLSGLSEGQHSLELIVLQPDPSFSSPEQLVMFQHWVIFNVNKSACKGGGERQNSLEDENSAHHRLHVCRIQMQLFLFSVSQLPRQQCQVPPGMFRDQIGVLHPDYVTVKAARNDVWNATLFGFDFNSGPSEDLFEVASVMAALGRAAGRQHLQDFLFVDFGAAWGRQAVRVVLLGHRLGINVRTIAVEAEPIHFEMCGEVYLLNGLIPGPQHRLVQGAVGWQDGQSDFLVGDSSRWWGQSLSSNPADKNIERVRMFTIKSLLGEEGVVDLLHLDVQGAELRSLTAAEADGSLRKIRALFIGTHSKDEHWGLLRLFCRMRWHGVAAFEPAHARGFSYRYYQHTWKPQDGVQVWLNPELVDIRSEFGRTEPVSCEGFSNVWPPVPVLPS